MASVRTTNSQRILAKGHIAGAPPKCPFSWRGIWAPPGFLGPPESTPRNAISIGSSVLAQLVFMFNRRACTLRPRNIGIAPHLCALASLHSMRAMRPNSTIKSASLSPCRHQGRNWGYRRLGTEAVKCAPGVFFVFFLLALSAGTLMASAGTPYRLVPAHFYPWVRPCSAAVLS